MSLTVLQRLRDRGLRPTVHRIGVLQSIEAGPVLGSTAEDIFRRMHDRGTHISIGTVYRAAKDLADAGLVLQRWDNTRKSIYRVESPKAQGLSVQVRCPDSGRLVQLDDPQLCAALLSAARGQGIELAGHALCVATG